jgi:flagellar hook-associated protein 1 FlgK
MQSDPTNKGHLDILFSPSDGSAPVVIKQSDLGGQIGGLVSARDGVLGQASTDLDTLAFDFARKVNAQNRAGFDLNGNQGGDVFTIGVASSNAAASITVDSAMAANPSLLAAASLPTSGPGDASNLAAMVSTQSALLSNNLDVTQGMARIVSDFGAAALDAQNAVSFNGSVLQGLQNARNSASGVSLDDEMVSLTQEQHAYEAMAKVINAAGSLLDTLIGMVPSS